MSISGIKNNNTSAYQTSKTAPGQKTAVSDKMTMGEYKKYIYNKISDMQNRHLNLGNSTAVDISEDGFRSMKNNPEYENWVFNQLETSLSTKLSDEPYCAIYHIGKDRNDFLCEVWLSEKQTKKQLSKKLEEDYLRKKHIQKKIQAKNEHYAQYRRVLIENSIRKADIESDHIKGQFGDTSDSQSLTAISSYRAIMNSTSSESSISSVSSKNTVKPKANKTRTDNNTEEEKTTVTFNAEKRSRQLASAKTQEQINSLLVIL